MRTSSYLESKHDLIVYPNDLVSGNRKKLPFLISGSLLFVIGGFWMTITGKNGGWEVLLFFSLVLLFFLIQFTWGPLLIINEREIRIRSNPFMRRLTLQWDTISTITLIHKNNNFYLGFALSPAHLETFLRHQSPLTRKILANRANRFPLVAYLSQMVLPCSGDSLHASIRKQYQTQIQQYSIRI